MSIVTTSGRIVKRKVSGVRPIVKACRAKALAPWAGLIYLPTEQTEQTQAGQTEQTQAEVTEAVRCGCGTLWRGGAEGEPCDTCKGEIFQADIDHAGREAETAQVETLACLMAWEGREYGGGSDPADYRDAAAAHVARRGGC